MSNMAGCESCTKIRSYGTLIQLQSPDTGEYLNIGGISGFNGPNITRSEIDVTDFCSTAKEYILDLKDNGTFSADMFFCPSNPSQRFLIAGLDSDEAYGFRVVLPDDGTGNTSFDFMGLVQGFPITGAMGAAITANLSLRITGDITWAWPEGVRLGYSTFVLNEESDNDGTVSQSIVVTLNGDTFAGAVGGEIPGVTFSGTPDGLTAMCTKTGGSTAEIAFMGNATSHTSGDTGTVIVSFGDASFSKMKASAVTGAKSKQLTINFID